MQKKYTLGTFRRRSKFIESLLDDLNRSVDNFTRYHEHDTQNKLTASDKNHQNQPIIKQLQSLKDDIQLFKNELHATKIVGYESHEVPYYTCNCVGARAAEVCSGYCSIAYSEVKNPIVEPDIERREAAAQKLEAANISLSKLQKSPEFIQTIQNYQDKQQKIKQELSEKINGIDNRVVYDWVLYGDGRGAMSDKMLQMLVSLYCHNDGNRIFIVNLLSICSQDDILKFVKNLHNVNKNKAHQLPDFILDCEGLGYDCSTVTLYNVLNLIVTSDVYGPNIQNRQHRVAGVKHRSIVIEKVSEHIANLEKMLEQNFLLTTTPQLIAASKDLLNILENPNDYDIPYRHQSPTIGEILTFWEKRVIPHGNIEFIVKDMIDTRRNVFSRVWSSEGKTLTRIIIDDIRAKYGEKSAATWTGTPKLEPSSEQVQPNSSPIKSSHFG